MPLLEICVDSAACALAALHAGAGRIELCAGMSEGGTTPSAGLIELCRERVSAPLHVMLRPRGGDFVYDRLEVEVMRRDLAIIRKIGVEGVVLGVLRSDGRVDVEATRRLVEAARPLSVTFHRAFDAARDADEAIDDLIAAGVDRVLSSGRARTATQGRDVLARMVGRAGEKLVVMAGGGVRANGVADLVEHTGVTEVHARPVERRRSGGYHNVDVCIGASGVGGSPPELEVIDPSAVAALRRALDEVGEKEAEVW